MELEQTAAGNILQDVSTPGAYLWEVEGKPVSVLLDLDVVDRLLEQILRGFGVVPRRSVEVGGVLLGSVEQRDGHYRVHVEDFEPVLCQYSAGPSYVLSADEQARFEETVRQWPRAPGRRIWAVGFYRSHVREGLGLDDGDIAVLNKYFPDAAAVALLVKPFATRASVGGFFMREGTEFRREASYREFPFRRRDLQPAAEAEPPRATRSAWPEAPPHPHDREKEQASMSTATLSTGAGIMPGLTEASPAAPSASTSSRKLRSGWVWIPLSFIFLLLGVLLGFQVASTVGSKLPAPLRQDPYGLNLSVTQSGENLHLRWDRNAPVILNSMRGTLWINDGGNQKAVSLDGAQLQNGSVIYRRATSQVEFRLEVTPRDRITVSETASFRVDALPGAR